jgi:hypothetical protein
MEISDNLYRYDKKAPLTMAVHLLPNVATVRVRWLLQ